MTTRQLQDTSRFCFDLSADLLCVLDKHGCFNALNPAWENICGADYPALVGQSYLDLVHPQDRRASLETLQALGAVNCSAELENRMRCKPHEFRWIHWHLCAVDGEIFASGRDIGEHKRAEQKLKAFLEFAPDAMIVVDAQGKIAQINAQTEKLFGYVREELIGQAIETLIPQRYHSRHVKHRQHFSQHPQARPMGTDMDLYAVRKDGSEFPAEISLGPAHSENDTFVLTAVRDISHRKQLEQALARKVEDLARSNAELEQFAYVASHDLQEPLRMISSFTQLLARRYQGQLDADADQYIAFAVEGAARMQHLINDLLIYSRAGTREDRIERSDCNRLLKTVLDNLHATITENQAHIEVGPLPTLMADPTQLAQLFQNLISNAIKYRNDRPLQIDIRAAYKDDAWVFSVADNGIGIAPQYFERIFQIFKRLHSHAEYAGTGIGLAICKRIVQRHGGRIWVESEPGVGSTFYFTMTNTGETASCQPLP